MSVTLRACLTKNQIWSCIQKKVIIPFLSLEHMGQVPIEPTTWYDREEHLGSTDLCQHLDRLVVGYRIKSGADVLFEDEAYVLKFVSEARHAEEDFGKKAKEHVIKPLMSTEGRPAATLNVQTYLLDSGVFSSRLLELWDKHDIYFEVLPPSAEGRTMLGFGLGASNRERPAILDRPRLDVDKLQEDVVAMVNAEPTKLVSIKLDPLDADGLGHRLGILREEHGIFWARGWRSTVVFGSQEAIDKQFLELCKPTQWLLEGQSIAVRVWDGFLAQGLYDAQLRVLDSERRITSNRADHPNGMFGDSGVHDPGKVDLVLTRRMQGQAHVVHNLP